MPKISIICILAMLSITSSASAKAEKVFPRYTCNMVYQAINQDGVYLYRPQTQFNPPFTFNFTPEVSTTMVESQNYINTAMHFPKANATYLFDKRNNRLVVSTTILTDTADGVSISITQEVYNCEASP